MRLNASADYRYDCQTHSSVRFQHYLRVNDGDRSGSFAESGLRHLLDWFISPTYGTDCPTSDIMRLPYGQELCDFCVTEAFGLFSTPGSRRLSGSTNNLVSMPQSKYSRLTSDWLWCGHMQIAFLEY